LASLFRLPKFPPIPGMPSVSAPFACLAMGTLIVALMFWRADVVGAAAADRDVLQDVG